MQNLEGDLAIDSGLARPIHDTRGAATDDLGELVARDLGPLFIAQ
jgi:hypothetical protein